MRRARREHRRAAARRGDVLRFFDFEARAEGGTALGRRAVMNRVLVALDATPNAQLVLARATELARTMNAKMRLLRVVHAESAIPAAMPLVEAELARARAELETTLLYVPEPMRDGTAVEIGRPADVICAYARTYVADVIIIGAHAHGAVARVLGTTAAKIVNNADRAVLVVRDAEEERAIAREPTHPKKHDEHTILEATTLAGGAAGAALGALAGPPGAIAGGTIGAVVGMLAGIPLDDTDRKRPSPSATHRVAASHLLRDEHARIERICTLMADAYRTDDWAEVRAQWDIFESALRAHMDLEERRVFPELERVDPFEAKALLAEHAELRRMLAELGIGIDLHAVPAADVDELLARIRAHGAREAALLYPWVDSAIDARALSTAA
jgi:universal stress protein F